MYYVFFLYVLIIQFYLIEDLFFNTNTIINMQNTLYLANHKFRFEGSRLGIPAQQKFHVIIKL